MDVYEVMRTTAAIRDFTGEELTDEVLVRIVDNARFAPSGGNRQGSKVIAIRDAATRERLAELTEPAVRRYTAQRQAGEVPWNPVTPCGVPEEVIAAAEVPAAFTEPLRTASVVLAVCVDLGTLAATDQDLDRIGIVGGASIYPLAWNLLLAARAEGFGGTFTTMLVAQEPAVAELLGLPEHWALACVLPLGKPVKQPTRLTRQSVADLLVRERFDGPPVAPEQEEGA